MRRRNAEAEPATAWIVPPDGVVDPGAGRGPATRRRLRGGVALVVSALLFVSALDGHVIAGFPVAAVPDRTTGDLVSAGAGTGPPDGAAAGAEAQGLLEAMLPARGPGCSAAFAEQGVVAWAGARGLAVVADGSALTADSRFDIGSLGEEFIAALVLILVQEGRLSVDDAVADHLDGFPAWADRLTLRDLLYHRSGLPDDIAPVVAPWPEPSADVTQQQVIESIRQVTALRFPPGRRFEYARADYVLLAVVAETATGQYLPTLVHDRITGPLRLDLTMDTAASLPDRVSGYRSWHGAPTAVTVHWAAYGAGGIQATPSDLVRWADNTRTGAVGGPLLVNAQTTDTVPTGLAGGRYGAGMMIGPDGSVEHRGSWPGFTVALAVRADHDRAIALACNDDSVPSGTIMQALRRIWFADP